MKTVDLNKVHLRRSNKPHYKVKLSCGIICATGMSLAAHMLDFALAGVVSMVINMVTAIFWIWE